ncbi:CU044_5270 family protein [Streptomyces sp. NPDC056549]|uniref:CU044_5270 family protein n=1 Tax=Streptomyces sp. NPDC056549 TaxID=3345864 RepID=UPI0036BE1F68
MIAEREQMEREQARRVLPAVDHTDAAPGRTEVRRRHLLSEIDRQTRARSSRFALRPRRRMVLVLGAAMAAGATVVVLSLGSGTTGAPHNVPLASMASVQVLERAALAASATSQTKVLDRQYVYVRTVGHTSVLSENKAGQMELLREDEGMEQWTSVDGSARTLQRKASKDSLLPAAPGSLNAPTYNFLAALPADPQALLKLIRDDAEKNHGAGSDSTKGPDQEAFATIGDLLRNGVTPPATAAALYRAAALIPGVDAAAEAVDAAGRRGAAVVRVHDGERMEWIFDTSTARLLGERTVLLEDKAWGKAGTVVTSVALISSGIVTEAGQTP